MKTFVSSFRGGSLTARALRSSFFTIGAFGTNQALRLASNLILTRLLFPEAFGMMALVMVILQGLNNFSDVGTTPAILQSKRGDERDFLNTAWTINVLRGVLLWLVACALAWPLSVFYETPLLAQLLPVTALSLIISGFNPTRVDTANRHLLLGRVTAIDITVQVIGIVAAIALAWWLQSVWALAFSNLIGASINLLLLSLFLPGEGNRFRWDRSAVAELVTFGKWIFLSTVCGFFISQGDKIVLGKWLPLDTFGVYGIGYFLASFPLLLGGLVTRKTLIPIYRENPPDASAENFNRLRKMRFAVTFALVAMVACFAAIGNWLVGVLYDPRYQLAGAIVVVMACMQLPQIIALTYDQAALAAGDSKRFFVLALARSVLLIGCLLVGLEMAGLAGALVAQGVAYVLAYPVVVWLSRKTGAWDPLHDLSFAIIGALAAAGAIWLNWGAVLQLPTG